MTQPHRLKARINIFRADILMDAGSAVCNQWPDRYGRQPPSAGMVFSTRPLHVTISRFAGPGGKPNWRRAVLALIRISYIIKPFRCVAARASSTLVTARSSFPVGLMLCSTRGLVLSDIFLNQKRKTANNIISC